MIRQKRIRHRGAARDGLRPSLSLPSGAVTHACANALWPSCSVAAARCAGMMACCGRLAYPRQATRRTACMRPASHRGRVAPGPDATLLKCGWCRADNPLAQFYGYDYVDTSDYSDAVSPADYATEYLPVASEDYSVPQSYDYLSSDYNLGDYTTYGDYAPLDYGSGASPAGADYGITGFDYGFYSDAPAPVETNGAAYAPVGYYDVDAQGPDVSDIIEGYLQDAYTYDSYDPYSYATLPVTAAATIYYGDEEFMLPPGNPWEGAADTAAPAAPLRVPVPEVIRNITTTGGTQGNITVVL